MYADYDPPSIELANVKFVEVIKETDSLYLCRTRWQGKDCVLKVFSPYKWDRPEDFANAHLYLISMGVVENIDPEAEGWQPQLKEFHDKTFPQCLDPKARPNGVLMEYIPDLKMFDLSNYTEQRARSLHRLLNDIHDAGIVHLDIYPRNMLIQGDSDRVLLIDYELAQIFDPEHSEHPRFFARERALMDGFVEALVTLSVPV
ncbi:hypothetical protein N7517_007185 [Penicillium concentricum]|uniref:Protein kinase domain-containing protein n=1 Tax=Penicillium concentricum TaxID=293559 RepID=A0A9W9SCR2_9EURO|nr:uncharacterized protein N7517_007185 [Penicillium concentricum]KAJ5375179.1 hypothetical protein N7517_007185 [Penicillium concentricum]